MFSSHDYYSRIKASADELPIEFVPWQEDVSSIYAELDLLAVPSAPVEATTRVILEAYSAGLPVVAFPAGGIPEILEDGVTGFLTKNLSAEALACRILSIVQMDSLQLLSTTRRARREWARRFNLSTYRNGVCQVLAEACSQTGEPPHTSSPEWLYESTGKGVTSSD
jgi:glycosyltransferase involved in cell wall biosynthesis